MAKRIVDEEMRFSVVINGNEAQKELFELEKSTRDLTKANKTLKAEKEKLRAQGKQDTQEYKNLTAEIKKQNVEIKTSKERMKVLQSQIGITSLTMGQLRSRASQLSLQLHNMTPGSAEYKKLQNDLKAVNARMNELRVNARGAESSISRLANGFNKYFALGASIVATGTGVVLSIQKIIDYNSKLSDSQSDVMKTTGLTKSEVDDLTKSFGLFKTRTARAELLGLATEAGRLGITGVKNIQDFVNVANQIKVALGDDLSDEAIREVGKITNIYKVGEQTGKDFAEANLALGSSINAVSASGANTAGYLVDYLKRQAGIAAQAKISADQNIGYAATFDEIGQSVEVSATAMNKIWIDLFENPTAYAKVAGMSVKDFNNLLQTDSNEAMILFLEGLNGNNEGLSIMTEKLKDLEVGGTRGVAAISALSGSTELLRKRQQQANEALIEATSLTEEYNLKNNNFAATIDKIQKKMVGFFASETIVNRLEAWAIWFAKFIGAAEDASGEVSIWRERLLAVFKVLLVLTASVLSYQAAIKLAALWTGKASLLTKIHYGLLVAQEIATKSLALAKALLTGNIQKVIVAYRALTATMALNPIGALVAIVGAAVAAYYAFSENAEKAATAQSILNKATNEAVIATRSEVNEVNALLAVARDEKASKEAKLVVIEKLNKLSPEYLGNLTLENINTKEATKSLDLYVDSLLRAAKAKALKTQLDAKAEELAKVESTSLEDHVFWYDELYNQLKSLNDPYRLINNNIKTAVKNKKELVDATKEELKILAKQYQEQLKINSGKDNPNGNSQGPKEGDTQLIGKDLYTFKGGKWVKQVFTPTGDPDKTKAKEYKVDSSKEAEELRRITEENDRLKASLINDSFKKEIALEEANHQAKLAKIREQKIEEAEMANLDVEIAKAKKSGNTARETDLSKTKEIWVRRNAELNRQMEYEEQVHQYKIGEIVQKGLQEQFKDSDDQFAREKVQRETAHNLALAALGNNAKAKKDLQKKFNDEESLIEQKHLQDLIAKMQGLIDGGNFKGFDLTLLSEEEKQKLLDFLDDANLKLSDLLNKASGASGGDGKRIDGDVDILGFSVDQWDATFENLDTVQGKIAATEMVLGAMMNAWSMYSDFVGKKQQVELQQFERSQDQKKEKLERQLATGLISQRQYNKSIDQVEKESAKKRAEMEYKQAKREKQMSVASILLNTAIGVAKAVAQSPLTFGLPWSAFVAASGAVQLGLALATPLPAKGYEDGLYPVRREQDGKMFNAVQGGEVRSGLVDRPTMFLAGEGGKRRPEMIIDDRAWKQMDPDVKNSIYRELGRMGRMPGYERGLYNSSSQAVSGSDVQPDSSYFPLFMEALNRNSEIMERLEKNGIQAIMAKNMENAKQIRESINDYDKLRNENKR